MQSSNSWLTLLKWWRLATFILSWNSKFSLHNLHCVTWAWWGIPGQCNKSVIVRCGVMCDVWHLNLLFDALCVKCDVRSVATVWQWRCILCILCIVSHLPAKRLRKKRRPRGCWRPRRCTGRYPAGRGGSLGAAVSVMPLYTRVRTFIDPGGGWCTVSGTANIQQLPGPLHTLAHSPLATVVVLCCTLLTQYTVCVIQFTRTVSKHVCGVRQQT